MPEAEFRDIPTDDAISHHDRWMRAALALGRRGMGLTAPNPAVAALVVKGGVLLGRGVTAPGGRPHAEPIALKQAGTAARGATLYVTLEPCSHYGRTPPCTASIIAAGICTVVYALGDPDARVAGRGFAQLRAAGIAVVGPVAAEQARRDHLGHILRVTHGRPAVTVKMAQTADGYAAHATGSERLLITGAHANMAVHRMRAQHDAVMVGIGTALADDPLLTVRLPGVAAHPVRVVLDSHLRLPPDSALVRSLDQAPLIVVTTTNVDRERREMLEARGVIVMAVPPGPRGLDLGEALRGLGERGLTRVFCEGGPGLASELIVNDFADIATLITGGRPLGLPGQFALTQPARDRLADRTQYRLVEDQPLGADRLRSFERM